MDNAIQDAAPDHSEALRQKDGAIEALRLDLAEAQLKLAEQEHAGDGRVQSLEKALMELKMHSARLLEENESFTILLSEKTLKGDFLHDHGADMSGMSTLAEELESSGENTEGQTDAYKKLEGDNRSLRDQNKALALYVDKIIGRLLQHEGFEHIIHDKDDPPKPPAKVTPSEKALPATPDQQIPLLWHQSVVSPTGYCKEQSRLCHDQAARRVPCRTPNHRHQRQRQMRIPRQHPVFRLGGDIVVHVLIRHRLTWLPQVRQLQLCIK